MRPASCIIKCWFCHFSFCFVFVFMRFHVRACLSIRCSCVRGPVWGLKGAFARYFFSSLDWSIVLGGEVNYTGMYVLLERSKGVLGVASCRC
ncbi:hypothetical protein V8F06_002088 [Rhypophila decipiens]